MSQGQNIDMLLGYGLCFSFTFLCDTLAKVCFMDQLAETPSVRLFQSVQYIKTCIGFPFCHNQSKFWDSPWNIYWQVSCSLAVKGPMKCVLFFYSKLDVISSET